MIAVYIIVGAVVIFIVGFLWGVRLLDVISDQMPGDSNHEQVIQRAIVIHINRGIGIPYALLTAYFELDTPLSDQEVINQIHFEVTRNGNVYSTRLEVLEAMLRRVTNE